MDTLITSVPGMEYFDFDTEAAMDDLFDGLPDGTFQVQSDGGSSSYYDLPEGASELNDLIEAKEMSFARGNIFKACYRLGEKAGTDAIYDINKIIYFAERLRGVIEKGRKP